MDEQRRRIRRSIREQLALLADHQRQRDYARDVRVADIPAELLSGWFDDSFLPDNPLLQAALQPAELEALARFHAEFAEVVADLVGLRTLVDLQAHPGWHRLAAAAAEALARLTPPGDEADEADEADQGGGQSPPLP